jgi:excisionase family DNA binding protein
MRRRPDEVMTIRDLSEYLKVARSTLYQLAQQGRIPCQKVGRHWRFHKATIDQWLSNEDVAKGKSRS